MVPNRLREAIAPIYLFLCLTMGGSGQGILTNMLLQLAGLALIAWAALAGVREPLPRPVHQLLWIVLFGLGVVALQLIPLPPSVWAGLGGRSELARDYAVLGIAPGALPLSLAPHETLATLLAAIPAIAIFCAMVRLRAYRSAWLALALVAGMLAGVLLGALQVSSADPRQSPWYLYSRVSFGFATGFFSNANHMATLLVISLPFLAALVASARAGSMQRYSAAVALAGGAALVVAVGLALNRSNAGYGLAVPVVAASVLIMIRARGATARLVIVGSAALLLAAVAALLLTPVADRSLGTATSVSSRAEIIATTAQGITKFLPFGSGLGTFLPVYRMQEDPDRVTTITMNHAHNDYVELALELGIPGVLLIVAFLVWWGKTSWRAWRFADASPYARAATIASAAMLIHSIVDYPLRTAALSACFAASLALLVERRPRADPDESELWPTRHVVLR